MFTVKHITYINYNRMVLSKSITTFTTKSSVTDPGSNIATNIRGLLIPSELNNLLDTPWMKCHLHSIGADLMRLETYKRFSHLLFSGGGGMIKTVVHDIATVIRRELSTKDSEHAKQIYDLIFLASNNNAYLSKQLVAMTNSAHSIGPTKWVYIFFGYLQLYRPAEFDMEVFMDKLIDIYLNTKLSPLFYTVSGDLTLDGRDTKSLDILKEYFNDVKVNKDLFKVLERHITLNETDEFHIELPALPEIKNKETLVKALMHKESYRALLRPEHNVAKELTKCGYDLNHRNYAIYRYELSFLDGLGDFYLARESSKLLCEFYKVGDKVHTHVYHLLKVILLTNTILSKMTLAYNLHKGLDDEILKDVIQNEYVPYKTTGKVGAWMDGDVESSRKFEEEFLADYFEGYVGALFLEDPIVAERFVGEIYANILTLITQTLPPDITYESYCVSVMGRPLMFGKKK